MQYNVLDEPTSVTTTDLAPQPGQSITSVTASAIYDDLGRVTSISDPDRGPHTYTYDNDGHVLSDVSGTRTIGANYDLLGRLGCVQDTLPSINATGACTTGSHPYVQNTYDTTVLGTQGQSDFPIGELTQSIATTYYPDGTTATVTEQSQHDQRGRIVAGHLQLTWPGSWGVTNPLPTYQLAASYNDADQLTTTSTSTNPAGQGYTTTNVYDSTTGALVGLGKTGSANATVASLTFTPHVLINTITLQTTTGYNYNFYCNPALDKLFAQEQATADPGVRQQIFLQIHLIYLTQFPFIVLYSPIYFALVHKGTHNYLPSPYTDTYNICEWWCDKGKC